MWLAITIVCATSPIWKYSRGVYWQSDQVLPGDATGDFIALKVIVTMCHIQYIQATCEESWQKINSFQIRTICTRLDESNMYLLF